MRCGESRTGLSEAGRDRCGLDKRAMIKSREAIDLVLERAERLLPLGGYVPGPDHGVPPDVPWKNYKYCMERLRKLVGKR